MTSALLEGPGTPAAPGSTGPRARRARRATPRNTLTRGAALGPEHAAVAPVDRVDGRVADRRDRRHPLILEGHVDREERRVGGEVEGPAQRVDQPHPVCTHRGRVPELLPHETIVGARPLDHVQDRVLGPVT